MDTKEKEYDEILKDYKMRLEEYESREHSRRAEMKLLISELEQSRAMNFELKELKRTTCSSNKLLMGDMEVAKLKQQYESIQIEYEDLKSKIKELETNLVNKTLQVEQMQHLDDRLRLLESEKRGLDETINLLKSDKDSLCNNLSIANLQLSKEKSHSEKIASQLKELSEQLRVIEGEGEGASDNSTIALLNEQKRRLKSRIEELEINLSASNEQCKQQKREIARLYEDSITLYEKLKLIENTKNTNHRKSYINPLIIMHNVLADFYYHLRIL